MNIAGLPARRLSLPHVRGQREANVALGSEPRHAESVVPFLTAYGDDSVI